MIHGGDVCGSTLVAVAGREMDARDSSLFQFPKELNETSRPWFVSPPNKPANFWICEPVSPSVKSVL